VAGYSGTPLPQKLGVKAGSRIGLARPPAEFSKILGQLPQDATVQDATRARGPFDVVVCFVRDEDTLVEALPKLKAKLTPAGGLWIAWPKKQRAAAASIPTDVTEATVRTRGLAAGLVDNKVCAIDDVWSGLRFVVRLAERSKA